MFFFDGSEARHQTAAARCVTALCTVALLAGAWTALCSLARAEDAGLGCRRALPIPSGGDIPETLDAFLIPLHPHVLRDSDVSFVRLNGDEEVRVSVAIRLEDVTIVTLGERLVAGEDYVLRYEDGCGTSTFITQRYHVYAASAPTTVGDVSVIAYTTNFTRGIENRIHFLRVALVPDPAFAPIRSLYNTTLYVDGVAASTAAFDARNLYVHCPSYGFYDVEPGTRHFRIEAVPRTSGRAVAPATLDFEANCEDAPRVDFYTLRPLTEAEKRYWDGIDDDAGPGLGVDGGDPDAAVDGSFSSDAAPFVDASQPRDAGSRHDAGDHAMTADAGAEMGAMDAGLRASGGGGCSCAVANRLDGRTRHRARGPLAAGLALALAVARLGGRLRRGRSFAGARSRV